MVGGDSEWAHELRRQLILEIELVSSGLVGADMEDGASHYHDDPADTAGGRIDGLRRRLEQVDRLIGAIEALQWEADEDSGAVEQQRDKRRRLD